MHYINKHKGIIHISSTNFSLSVFQQIKSGRNVNTPPNTDHEIISNLLANLMTPVIRKLYH